LKKQNHFIFLGLTFAIPSLFVLFNIFSFVCVFLGNGTQNAFYSDPNVLYFSIHRYENANFFPNDFSAGHKYSGEGEASGKCVKY